MRIYTIHLRLDNENHSPAETVGNNVRLQLRSNPLRRAAAEESQVGVMNSNLSSFSGGFLVDCLVPNGSEKSHHTGVEMITTEEVANFVNEDSRLPVGGLSRHHFIHRHFVHHSFSTTAVAGQLHRRYRPTKSLGHVHRTRLPQTRLPDENDV